MIIPGRFQDVERHDKAFLSFLDGTPYEELYSNTLLSEELVRKCGYFSSFPNYLYSVFPIDPSHYTRVGEQNQVLREDLGENGFFLLPAACVEVYPYYFKYRVGTNAIFSIRAKVFRQEEGISEIRLNEFTLRELVCIGDLNFVEGTMTLLKERALAYASQIGLSASFVNASDMFYPSAKNVVLQKLQKKNGQKQELTVMYNGKPLAIASANYHGTHFCEIHGYHKSDLQSACIGFGIERWIESETDKPETGN